MYLNLISDLLLNNQQGEETGEGEEGEGKGEREGEGEEGEEGERGEREGEGEEGESFLLWNLFHKDKLSKGKRHRNFIVKSQDHLFIYFPLQITTIYKKHLCESEKTCQHFKMTLQCKRTSVP